MAEEKAPPIEPPEPPKGLVCSRCGCTHFETENTVPVVGGIRRYKRCRHCGKRAPRPTFEAFER